MNFSNLGNNFFVNVPGTDCHCIDPDYMRHIYTFFHDEPIIAQLFSLVSRFVMEGGVTVAWCATGDARSFNNIGATKDAEQTDTEMEVLTLLVEAYKWYLMFGFVPVHTPAPLSESADDDDNESQNDKKKKRKMKRQIDKALEEITPQPDVDFDKDKDRPNTTSMSTNNNYPRFTSTVVPKFVVDAVKRAHMRVHTGVDDGDDSETGLDMKVPRIPPFGTGKFYRISDEVSSDVKMIYVPNYTNTAINTPGDLKNFIRNSGFTVFVWPGHMPDTDGRIMSVIAPLVRSREVLTALEINMLDAEYDAAHPPLVHQDRPTSDRSGADSVQMAYGAAIGNVAGSGSAVSGPKHYTESRQGVVRLARELQRKRAQATGRGGASSRIEAALAERKEYALETGGSLHQLERLSNRLFAMPADQQLAGSGPQARTWQNVLDHTSNFEEKIFSAMGVPRSYLNNSGAGGKRSATDAITSMAALRTTITHVRETVKRFFDFSYDTVNRDRDNAYIASILDGLHHSRRQALSMLDASARMQIEALEPKSGFSAMRRLTMQQEQTRLNVEHAIMSATQPFERAKKASRRARLLFRQTPMVTLPEIDHMAMSGVISVKEEIVLARRALQLDGHDTCAAIDTSSIPPEVLRRKMTRESLAGEKRSSQSKPDVDVQSHRPDKQAKMLAGDSVS